MSSVLPKPPPPAAMAQDDQRSPATSPQRLSHPSAMTERPGWLALRLLRWLLSAVTFPRRVIASLLDANRRGRVVYVMQQRSLLDYLYFNVAFLRENIPLVRYANGLNTWPLRSFWSGLFALFGVGARARWIAGPQACRHTVASEAPALLFLRQSRRKDVDPKELLPFFEELLELQRSTRDPILLIPLLLVWSRRPESGHPTFTDQIFGSAQRPGRLRKAFTVFQSFWQSLLRLGAPTVQTSSELNLRELLDDADPDRATRLLALEILDRVEDALRREERIVSGPWVKNAALVRQEILDDERTREAIAHLAPNPEERSAALQRAHRILKEIAADFDISAIKAFSAILTPVWNQIYDGFEIDDEGFHALRETSKSHRVVLVPSHKSHIDYLVLSYVFYQHGLIPPHIAAGVNLNFWPVGGLFRRSGAFFLRRTFSDDPLYAALFHAYLTKVLEEGFPIEFFIEGTRSRTGKLNPPKYGMLNMIVQAALAGDARNVVFVPVSVGYEKIIEGSAYRSELEGAEKKSEGIVDLLKAPAILRSRYGRVYVEFGHAMPLDPFLLKYHPNILTRPPSVDDMNRTVRRLAYRIIHGINEVTTVTPSAVAALVILNQPSDVIDHPTFLRQAGFVLRFVALRGARLSRTLIEALAQAGIQPDEARSADDSDLELAIGVAVAPILEEALALLHDNKLIVSAGSGHQRSHFVPKDRRVELSYYKNNILHFFVPEAIFATALCMQASQPTYRHELEERTRFLSRLLKYEFCFASRDDFEHVFAQAYARFQLAALFREQEDGRIVVPDPPPPAVEFLRGLALTTLEAYRFCALLLNEEALDWVDQRSLLRKGLQRSQELMREGALVFSESVNRPSLESALRLFREWAIIEERRGPRGRRDLRVHPGARGAVLPLLSEELGLRALPQRRDPKASLHQRGLPSIAGPSLPPDTAP